MNISLNHNAVALELTYLNLIKISGRDAISFLNDQFTNDITALETNRWQYNGYCSAKGRLIAFMRLFTADDCIYIVMPASMASTLIQRLQVYVFRAKVNFEILNEIPVYCLMGDTIKAMTGERQTQAVKSVNGGFLLNISEKSDRYLMVNKVPDNLSGVSVVSGDEAKQFWRLSEIQAAIPNIDTQISELFIPQHISLDKLHAISFQKGCFPGQEVVARLHYLGKAKQTMKQLQIHSVSAVNPGDTITHTSAKKPVKIVDAIETGQAMYDCLAVGQFD